MKIKTESERPVDLYQLIDDFKINLPFMMTSVPLPLSFTKRMTVTVYLDSKSSDTKEIDMFFNMGKFSLVLF